MTEEIAAAPGWFDERLDEAFAGIGPAGDGRVSAARDQYARCVSGAKQPGAPSDLLGAECERCRNFLLRALAEVGVEQDAIAQLGQRLETIEAELAADS